MNFAMISNLICMFITRCLAQYHIRCGIVTIPRHPVTDTQHLDAAHHLHGLRLSLAELHTADVCANVNGVVLCKTPLACNQHWPPPIPTRDPRPDTGQVCTLTEKRDARAAQEVAAPGRAAVSLQKLVDHLRTMYRFLSACTLNRDTLPFLILNGPSQDDP